MTASCNPKLTIVLSLRRSTHPSNYCCSVTANLSWLGPSAYSRHLFIPRARPVPLIKYHLPNPEPLNGDIWQRCFTNITTRLFRSLTPFNLVVRLDVDPFYPWNVAGDSLDFLDHLGVFHNLGAGAKSNDAVAYEYLNVGF